jgi:putative transposase
MLHRKSVRLEPRNDVGCGTYFLTVCCDHHYPYLVHTDIATAVRDTLLRSAKIKGLSIHAYCLMPDHVHVLAEGTCPAADALEFVRYFKQVNGFRFKKQAGKNLWEFSFYDHILSASDEIIEVARYIWRNPKRKKLCEFPCDYPFSGSQTLSWMQRSNVAPTWAAPWRGRQAEKARV